MPLQPMWGKANVGWCLPGKLSPGEPALPPQASLSLLQQGVEVKRIKFALRRSRLEVLSVRVCKTQGQSWVSPPGSEQLTHLIEWKLPMTHCSAISCTHPGPQSKSVPGQSTPKHTVSSARDYFWFESHLPGHCKAHMAVIMRWAEI